MQKISRIITIKWGSKYSHIDVNRLYKAISKNTSHKINFYCFTDHAIGLDPDIIINPLPSLEILPEHKKYYYLKEAGLCEDNLGGLNGERVFFFDLDVVICGNLDELFTYPQEDEFIIAKDWNSPRKHVGQASLYSWRVGTLGYIAEYYCSNPYEVVKKFRTASQEYLSAKVKEKQGELKFWPIKWCISFKNHCLPPWYLRYFKYPSMPSGAKVIAFHGDPKVANALKGVWSDGYVPFFKRIYKKNMPATWLLKYLEE